jgi:hypothetical protein
MLFFNELMRFSKALIFFRIMSAYTAKEYPRINVAAYFTF